MLTFDEVRPFPAKLAKIILGRAAVDLADVEGFGLLPQPFSFLLWTMLGITTFLGLVIVVMRLCVVIKHLWQSLELSDDRNRDEVRSRSSRKK